MVAVDVCRPECVECKLRRYALLELSLELAFGLVACAYLIDIVAQIEEDMGIHPHMSAMSCGRTPR